jgi:hypothetical protein
MIVARITRACRPSFDPHAANTAAAIRVPYAIAPKACQRHARDSFRILAAQSSRAIVPAANVAALKMFYGEVPAVHKAEAANEDRDNGNPCWPHHGAALANAAFIAVRNPFSLNSEFGDVVAIYDDRGRSFHSD